MRSETRKLVEEYGTLRGSQTTCVSLPDWLYLRVIYESKEDTKKQENEK